MSAEPKLLHALAQSHDSVLSLIADEAHIFSGSQEEEISVWDRRTFIRKSSLKGHTGSVLALELASERRWLLSSSGDSTVRIWCTMSLSPLYTITPHLETDAGDLFSLAWSPQLQTVFFGCQDTSVQWYNCASLDPRHPATTAKASGSKDEPQLSDPSQQNSLRKVHKFFDSYPQYERRPADLNAMNNAVTSLSADDGCVEDQTIASPIVTVSIPADNVLDSAHFGYVYCMALVPSHRDGSDDMGGGKYLNHLVTGSGDETLNLWSLQEPQPKLVHTFECNRGAILSVVTTGETIYAGCQDGYILIWDMETKTLVRALIAHENVAVMSLSLLHSDLYACLEDGRVQRWSGPFNKTASWVAHDGIVHSSVVARKPGTQEFELITGGSDEHIKVWQVNASLPHQTAQYNHAQATDFGSLMSLDSDDAMFQALSNFVSHQSVSNDASHREDCRQTAIWLRKCLTQLGGRATLLPTGDGTNPLVLATFSGTQTERPKLRVLFYGHYDVISAPKDGWESDPFSLHGRNGYLYGRGVTDDKAPILAVAFAAAELLQRRALGIDLVFLIEGEEEAGSVGFAEAVERHKSHIGHIDSILVSNSSWIAEDTPCITYGLRGVVHCSLEISSKSPDLHSGVDGGAVAEPMLDMIKVLGGLADPQRKVLVAGFYDQVRPLTDEEKPIYQLLSRVTQRPASLLSSRWREPSLTIHNIEVSGPNNATVIPSKVKARVSVRIVPDQDLASISSSLCSHLESTFRALGSPNQFKARVERTADWWLGNLDDPFFKALETAVRDEWGIEPLRIREGGSIPSIPFLEKQFKCHALHLPLGQSSDQAHLPNERISVSNLRRGRSVITRYLSQVSALGVSAPEKEQPAN